MIDVVRDLHRHPERADDMQKQALAWYHVFMRDFVARFEATLDERAARKKTLNYIVV